MFMALTYAKPYCRHIIAQKLIGFGNWLGVDISPLVHRFYDDHHLFLISVGFLTIAVIAAIAPTLICRAKGKCCLE